MSPTGFPESAADFFTRVKAGCLPRIEKATVPFYGIQGNDLKRDRTGVLYKLADHYFILSASHKLRTIVKSNIPLYIDRTDKRSLPIPLAGAVFHGTEEEGRDVAAIRLPKDVVRELVKTKEFLNHSDVRLSDETKDSLYVVFGYPEDWSGAVSAKSLLSAPLVFASRRYRGERHPNAFFDARVHILLEFDQMACSVTDDDTHELPRLHGASGCGIWRVAEFSKEGFERWRPEHLSLVAIQHRWFPKRRYIQGTWVGYAIALVRDNYPEISEAMKLVYPRR